MTKKEFEKRTGLKLEKIESQYFMVRLADGKEIEIIREYFPALGGGRKHSCGYVPGDYRWKAMGGGFYFSEIKQSHLLDTLADRITGGDHA